MSKFTDLHQYEILQQINDGYYFDPNGVLVGAKANWAPIPENDSQPIIRPRSAILHTNAGPTAASWQNIRGYAMQPGNDGECHFDVDNTGAIGQFLSIYRRGDCNFNANSWLYAGELWGAISIETGDHGAKGIDVTGWNLDQLHSIGCILTALAIQADIGCNEVLSWNGKGIDYHSKFPYVGPGVPAWTNVVGKTCPGKQRKLQVPFVRNLVATNVSTYVDVCNQRGVPVGIQF